MSVIEAIKKIYPEIQGGYSYWNTKYDSSPLDNPIDGLIWENTEFEKPTWNQIEAFLNIINLDKAKLAKIAQVKINRDNWMYQPVEYSGNTYFATKIAGDNLTAAARSPRNIGIGSVQWMTTENSVVELEISQMEDIINLIEDQRRYSYFQEALLSAEINAIEIIENEDPEIAVTYEQAIEALNNIDITF